MFDFLSTLEAGITTKSWWCEIEEDKDGGGGAEINLELGI